MKNFTVIVCDYFREYGLLNNLENDKKNLTVERLWIFFFILHIWKDQLLLFSWKTRNYYSYYYVNFSQNKGRNICPSALIYFKNSKQISFCV